MRKAILLGAIAALGALSFGCALTDYGTASDFPFETLNKTHGVIGCLSSDRFANTQQTVEPLTRDMLYTEQDADGNTICPVFDPLVSTEFVSREDARAWQRFNGPYAFAGELQVFGTGGGTWASAGMKDLPDGSVRLTTYGSTATGQFSCVGSAVNGRYGGPEGVVSGDGYAEPGSAAARIPGWAPDSISIDDEGGSQFCENIVAVSQNAASTGFSVMVSLLGRGGEGHAEFSPVTRRAEEGLASFLAGGQLSLEHAGVSISAHGGITPAGNFEVFVDSLAHAGVTYEAVEPIRLVVNPADNFRTLEVHPTDAEMRAIARFALDAGLTDRALSVGGVIPELGTRLPEMEILLVGTTAQDIVNNGLSGRDGGFGG